MPGVVGIAVVIAVAGPSSKRFSDRPVGQAYGLDVSILLILLSHPIRLPLLLA